MRIAIIPARGGSKRIPRKNIRAFAGKPMISYAIGAARQSGVFDHVLVSTDDVEIAAVSRDHGAETPFSRPAELADDHTPTVPVISHGITACRALGWDVDAVCCIYPGVPFLEPADLVTGLELLEAGSAEYAFPVVAFPSPVQRALRRLPDGTTRPLQPEHASTRTQDLEPAYFDAGQFYWGRAAAWTRGLNIHQHGCTLVLPEWRVIDIDTPDDWDRAERMARAFGLGSAA